MKITTLLENTACREDLAAAHGLSLYIETPKHKILVDMGPDDTFLDNAKALGIDLEEVDVAILSMGSLPKAIAKTFPNVIPTSSMRWWSLSPVAVIMISIDEYLENVSIMCLRNWSSHVTSYFPVPSTFSSMTI